MCRGRSATARTYGLGLVGPRKQHERPRPGEPQLELRYAERPRALERPERFLGALHPHQERAGIVMRDPIVRGELERAPIALLGLEEPPLIHEHEAEQRPALRVTWLRGQRPPRLGLALCAAPEVLEREASEDWCRGHCVRRGPARAPRDIRVSASLKQLKTLRRIAEVESKSRDWTAQGKRATAQERLGLCGDAEDAHRQDPAGELRPDRPASPPARRGTPRRPARTHPVAAVELPAPPRVEAQSQIRSRAAIQPIGAMQKADFHRV